MGIPVHKGWTPVDLSWNQLYNLPFLGSNEPDSMGSFSPPYPEVALDTFGFPVGVWGSNQPVRTARGTKPLQELFLAKFGPFGAVLAQN